MPRGFLHVDYWCVFTRGYQVKFEPFFSMCIPRCIFYVIYWCTFPGVFYVNCFTWIDSVPVHMYIMWISCEVCHLVLFHMFSMCIFNVDYGVSIHVYIWPISCDV